MSASTAAGIAPARIIVVSTIERPRKMYSPSPPAPIAAAIVAVPTPTTAATRTPATIDGSASGSSTIHSNWRDVMPIATPASMTARSTLRRPATVVRTTGSNAYSVSVTSAVRGPTPPMNGNGNRNPNSARLGIVCVMLAMASTGRPSRGRRNAKMPAGRPSAVAAPVETITSRRCCRTSSSSSPA